MNLHQAQNLRLRTAELAVGPSTVRNAGATGVVDAARSALKAVPLESFRVRSREEFLDALQKETKRIQRRLPKGARHWGVARKVVNIFLRSCAYNRSLARFYGIANLEPWLELPLDSQIAKGIRMCSGDTTLRRWRTVKGLSYADSEKYQSAARALARRKGVRPIHLEACWWRTNLTRCRCADR